MLGVGRVALVLAIVGCALAGGAGLAFPRRARLVRGIGIVGAAASSVAVIALGWAFVAHDFSLVYVADHSRRGIGAWDRVAGVWGGMAGSLLLFGALVVVLGVVGTRTARATAVAAGAGGALLAADRWLADPFRTLAIPAIDGSGLTPILEHPAMRVHPPIVYLGLCALVVPFALALTAEGSQWWPAVRRWLLVSWTLLGLGMVIGAWWAYAELGWGGYWAWDPVENSALLPWLAATVALHLAPRGAPTRAGVVAAAAPFPLAVLGSMLTRSGATGSVHAFAEARSVGRALLVLLGVVTVAVVAVAVRRRSVRPERRPWPLTAGVAVLATVTGLVAVGTVVPALRGAFGGDRSLIDGQWFAQLTGPAAVIGLMALAVGPGRRATARVAPPTVGDAPPSASTIKDRLARVGVDRPAAVRLGAGAAFGLALWVGPGWPAFAGLLAGSAVAAGAAALGAIRRPSGLAHLGITVLLVGVAGTSAGGDATVTLEVGDSVGVDGHEVVLRAVEVVDGPVPDSAAVVAVVTIDGYVRRPALVAYRDRGVLLAETSLRSTPLADVQVVLLTASDDDEAVLSVHVNPLQQLVWWGGLLTVGAGALALTCRRPGPQYDGRGASRAASRASTTGPAQASAQAPAALVVPQDAAVAASGLGPGPGSADVGDG